MQNQMEIELPGLKRVQAAATAPVKASTREIGYAQAVLSNWWLYEDEKTPELQWPQSVAVYDQMRRTDAQVASVLEAVTLPVRRTPWRIDPNGARATVVKFVANDLGLPIVGKDQKPAARMKGKFSWPEHLRMALLELVYGHMFFEQVYSVNDAGTEAHLKKLAPRMPKTISEIDVAADGGLVSITQWWTATNRQRQPIPVDRLVAYVRNREGGNWLGQSILRPAYKNWLLKDRLLRVQAQTVERNGMGIPLYKAQEGASGADLTAGKDMATAWRAGEAAGSAVPYGADLVLRGVEGTLPDADVPIRYHDEQIARSTLAHFLNLGTQTGSWALGTTFADFFVFSLQTLAQQIADVTTQHVIEDLVDLNFGEDEPAPKLVFDEIGSQQQATAQALKLLVDAGIIHPDEVLEGTSRQQYGLPPADPATATPPPGASGAAPVEPTPTGALSVAARRRARRSPVSARYNPGQPRDPGGENGGQWVSSPGSAAKAAVSDALKLAGKIDLAPDEHLVSSAKLDGDSGGIRMALTEHNGQRTLRFGAGGEGYGKPNREEGTPAWDGNPSRAPLSKAERERLFAEEDALDAEWDGASPARQDEIDRRRDAIREQLAADDQGFNGTAKLDEYSMRRLADRIRPALAEAVEQEKAENAAWDEIEALEAKGNPDPARMAELRRIVDRDSIIFTQGVVPGSAWGDVHFSVELDDPSVGPEVRLGVQPKGAPDDWGGDKDWQGTFDPAETRKFLRLLDKLTNAQVTAKATPARPAERRRRNVRARYNPAQKRDPNGEWGDGVPGPGMPELDMEGFDLIDEAEGSFGSVQMGTDESGDVRLAFHEGNEARAIDLGVGEFEQLVAIVRRLGGSRDSEIPDDAESSAVYDDDRFGYDSAHKVELLGNGVISITFGADDPDPYTLNLDPPDSGGSDDVAAFLRAADEVASDLNGRVTAAAGVDTHPGGEELKHYWVYGEGAAKWSTFTELFNHLRKYLATGMAKRTAAAWFHLRYGFWPGSDVNRVKHGKPPRGHVVGPG